KLRSYLLKGLVRCAHCGRAYIGVTRNGRSHYRCGGRSGLPWGAEKCPARKLGADALEKAVFVMCGAFLKGPRGILEEARRREGLKAQTAQSLRRELEDVAREQKEEQATEARAFRLASMGKVSEDVFQQEAERIRLRRRWLQERREKLEADLGHAEGLERALDSVDGLRQRLERYLEGGTPEDRRFVLEALGANVIARPDATWDLELRVPPPSEPDGQSVITGPGFPALSEETVSLFGLSPSGWGRISTKPRDCRIPPPKQAGVTDYLKTLSAPHPEGRGMMPPPSGGGTGNRFEIVSQWPSRAFLSLSPFSFQ
ncbi:MAG: recombinase zinc beta ribbon domain-containing protein, partial [Chloroflexota bacterium]|nr:recombinase zinc beta ribbon domain-containing protein [Chloroflexota bacterium]